MKIFTRLGWSGLLLAGWLLVSGSTSADPVPPKLALDPASTSNVSLRNEAKHAIDKGLAWLEKNQDASGYWSAEDHPAVSALALMALKGRPGKPNPVDAEVLKKGYDYLLASAKPDGGIYGTELQCYNTSVVLTALVAAGRPDFQPAIAKARKFISTQQAIYDEPGSTNSAFSGGVGYGGQDKRPDLSATILALEAMYYSKPAGENKEVANAGTDLNWKAAIHFVQSCQNLPGSNTEKWASDDPQNKGGFIYAPGKSMAGETNLPSGRVALRSYGTMSYAGLLAYIYADLKPDDPREVAVMDWLRANFSLDENPGLGQEGIYYYYLLMAKALTLHGVDMIETKEGNKVNWREKLVLKILDLQKPDGSWVNENGRWWEKDPVIDSAFVLMALEIVYGKL